MDALLNRIGFERLTALEEGAEDQRAGRLVRELFSGELILSGEAVRESLERQLSKTRVALARQTGLIAAPGLLCCLLSLMLGRGAQTLRGFRLACCAAEGVILIRAFSEAQALAREVVEYAGRAADDLSTVLISASALTGVDAAGLAPASTLCTAILTNVFRGPGLALCGAFAAAAVVGALTEAIDLSRLFSLGKGIALWVAGILTAAFMGILSMDGLLTAGRDGAASRAAHLALESLVPVIGGEVSESLESLAASAVRLKNAVGVTGMLLVLATCLRPVLQIASSVLSVKMAGALSGLAGERRVSGMATQFAEVMELLLAISLASVLLVLMLVGGFLALPLMTS